MHRAPRPAVPRTSRNCTFLIPRRMPKQIEPVKRLAYSIPETAAALGISESTVKRLIQNGELASAKVLKRTVVPVAAIRKLLGS